MSTATAYAIRPSLALLSHWSARPLNAADYISVDSDKVDVQVKSGDYFVTLATKIELISQRLANEHDEAATGLEQAVNELLYLQNYYDIIRKTDK